MLTQEKALRLFEYSDGKLYVKQKTNPKSNKRKIGEEVGHMTFSEYLRTKVDYEQIFVHKIIFLMHHGYMPQIVDHIDGNTLNNKIENLRAANLSQNQHNRDICKKNTSGFKNVSWCKRTKKWQVIITCEYKKRAFGRYEDIELADLVAQEARDKYHKEFVRKITCSR